MKKGINAWCLPHGMCLSESFKFVKEAGYDGLELNMEENDTEALNLSLESDGERYARILALSKQYELPVSSVATGLHWKYSLTDNDPEKVKKGMDAVGKMIDAAAFFGADTVLVVPGVVTQEVPYDTAYGRALNSLNELKAYAEEKRVIIGVENVWNKFLLSPLEFRNFIDAINSDFVKVYFDAGNILQFGFPEQWVSILNKRITKVHVKDFNRSIGNIYGFASLLHGDMDFELLIHSLKTVGYDDYITAELSPYKQNPLQLTEDTAKALEYIVKL